MVLAGDAVGTQNSPFPFAFILPGDEGSCADTSEAPALGPFIQSLRTLRFVVYATRTKSPPRRRAPPPGAQSRHLPRIASREVSRRYPPPPRTGFGSCENIQLRKR